MLQASSKFKFRSAVFTLLLLAVMTLGSFGSSLAQNEATGTVEGLIDGEARSWYTVLFAGEETDQPTATWSADPLTSFSIQAHPELLFSVSGTLSIEFWSFEFPDDCPCTFPQASVMLWTGSSVLENIYQDDEATVTITSLEHLADDALAIKGSFTANLAFQASLYEEPDADDTLPLEGTFSIEYLPRDGLFD